MGTLPKCSLNILLAGDHLQALKKDAKVSKYSLRLMPYIYSVLKVCDRVWMKNKLELKLFSKNPDLGIFSFYRGLFHGTQIVFFVFHRVKTAQDLHQHFLHSPALIWMFFFFAIPYKQELECIWQCFCSAPHCFSCMSDMFLICHQQHQIKISFKYIWQPAFFSILLGLALVDVFCVSTP